MTAALRVEALVRSFGGTRAVDGVSLTVDPGACVALIGPNGSGKSTLLDIVTGYLAPEAGRVCIYGQDVTGRPPGHIACLGVSRTFQRVAVVPDLPVLENLLLMTAPDGRETVRGALLPFARIAASESEPLRRARSLLDRMDLSERASLLARELSHGEQKLTALAGAVMRAPRLLLLDEPFAALSPVMIDRCADLVSLARTQGAAIVFVEHNLDTVRSVCQRVVVMARGRIIADGLPERVLDERAVLEEYLG